MGGLFYCQKLENSFEMTKNEIELSEALRKEKYFLKSKISHNILDDKNTIDDINENSYNRIAVPKLQGVLRNLDTNFINIVIYQILEQIEERFMKEKYLNFQEIKMNFIIFYGKINENTLYQSLICASTDYNEYLNMQIIKREKSKG